MARWEFKLPDIGEGIAEGEIVAWAEGIAVGQLVNADQPLAEIMTDKATVVITCPKSGVVTELGGRAGDVVPVGSNLIVLETEATEPAATEQVQEEGATPVTKETNQAELAASAVGDIRETLPGMNYQRTQPGGATKKNGTATGYFVDKPLATPATRRLARERAVDLRTVAPTGVNQRVTSEDVRRAADKQNESPPRGTSTMTYEVRPPSPPTMREERIPLRGVRRKTFEQMARSKRTAAHSTFVEECDVTALLALRSRLQPHAEKRGVRLTFLPFIVKATVAALRQHPELNASFDEATSEIVRYGHVHLGIATATDMGLIVPVLKHAENLSLLAIAGEIARLSASARAGTIKREEMHGSTFTITSLGQQSGLMATPVLNFPEIGILGVHRIRQRPVVRDGQIVIGDIMTLSLSFDHRLIDGHIGAAFAYTIIEYLEEPTALFLDAI